MTRFSTLIPVAPIALSLVTASSAFAGTPAPEYDVCSTSSTPLVAGQYSEIGDVVVTQTEDRICVSFDITEDDWYLVETHVAIVTDVGDFPRTRDNSPRIGHFPMQRPHYHEERSYEHCVTIDSLGCGADAGLYIAAHASVERRSCDGVERETAWGRGEAFQCSSWAMYFSHELQSCSAPECAEDEIWDDHADACVARCAADHVWNAETERCDDRCVEGETWDAEAGKCDDRCAAGELWDVESGACVELCAEGETWNVEAEACVSVCKSDEIWMAGSCERVTECGEGESWDADSNACIVPVIECDGQLLWSDEYNACIEISVIGGGCSVTGSSPGGAAALFFLVGALALWRRRRVVAAQ